MAGYANDSAADSLKQDPLFSQVFELTASQPKLSRFINQKEEQDNRCVHQLMTRLGELLLTETNQRQVIIDIDSTHSDTFGKQEDSEYNGHYKYNKCKTFYGRTRKTVHFYQYWKLLMYNPQIYPQLIFQILINLCA
ncbi:MAG: hypothetical protein GX180_12965 [Enterococcus sp.]|nr:hypothetical protein [Enterococcus sp.]